MAKCKLVEKGEVRRRANTADMFLYQGKLMKTCFGYIDPMTDWVLPECQKCYYWERNWDYWDYDEDPHTMKPLIEKRDD